MVEDKSANFPVRNPNIVDDEIYIFSSFQIFDHLILTKNNINNHAIFVLRLPPLNSMLGAYIS